MYWAIIITLSFTLTRAACPSGFYVDLSIPEGDPCSRWKKSGESCKNSTECDQTQHLECITGICKCNPSNSVFQQGLPSPGETVPDASQGKCVGRVGTKCSSDKPCMSSASCSAAGSCTCKSEFTPTSDRLCGRSFQESCSDNQVCKDGLVCVHSIRMYPLMPLEPMKKSPQRKAPGRKAQNSTGSITKGQQTIANFGICQCPEKYEVFDYAMKTCKALMGAPCNNSTKLCVDNAICLAKKSSPQPHCECKQGFVGNMEGQCDIEHGKQCNYMTADLMGQAKCDRMAQLVCKKGLCSCQVPVDVYDPMQRRCVGTVGSRCRSDRDCLSEVACFKDNQNRLWGRCGEKSSTSE